MKYLFLSITLAFLFLSCSAQVQFNAVTSIIKGAGYYDNHALLIGAGLSMRYMLAEKLFIGGSIRAYHGATTTYESYNAMDKAFNYNGIVDYVFRKRYKVQPYLGIGVGVSRTSHMVNYMKVFNNFTMFSARGGTHIAIGKSTGFFAQVEYNYTGGDGSPTPLDGIRNLVATEPVSKYIAIDCGLFMRLYLRK